PLSGGACIRRNVQAKIFPEMALALRREDAAAQPGMVLGKAVMNAAARLGLRQREVAAILGMSEASISRVARGRGIDPASKEGELALLFVRLYRSLDTLVGGDDGRARAWLAAPNDHLGGAPGDRLTTVQ